VRRDTLLHFLLGTSDVHVDLLERANVVRLAVREVGDRAHHSRTRAEQVQTRVLSSLCDRHVSDLQVKRNLLVPLGLEASKQVCEKLGLSRGRPTDDPSVKLHHDRVLAVQV
jgi:hypothetical protein